MQNQKSRISFLILPLIILLAIACVFSLRAPMGESAHAADYGITSLSGNGTEASPKHIHNPEEFLFFMDRVNDPNQDEAYLSYYYTLDNDIDLENILKSESFKAIGTLERPFNGTFDGKGHLVSHVSLFSDSNVCGVFGYTGTEAVIKNVGVVNSRIETTGNVVGGLVGQHSGNVNNSFYQGVVKGVNTVGGLVGINQGEVSYSFTNGSVVASSAYLGGLVAKNEGKLHYSYSLSSIVSNSIAPTFVGGVIGARSNELATPLYTFYNASLNEGIDGVGYSSRVSDNAYDKSPVTLSTERVRGLTRKEFNTMDGFSVFGSVGNEAFTRAFNVSNHSSYVAFLQNVFIQEINKPTTTAISKLDYQTACSERMYGIDVNNVNEWGSEESPYLISDKQHLINLQNAVSTEGESYLNKIFKQTNDVDFKVGGENSEIKTIGSFLNSTPFQGKYDGSNYRISGFRIEGEGSDARYLGLFGYTGESAIISNLSLTDCSIIGEQNVGSLIGLSNGSTVTNVETEANVSARGNSGGLIGLARGGNYSNVLSEASLSLLGTTLSGGLYGVIGEAQATPTLSNVWYITELGGEYTSTNKLGSVLIVDTKNGNVSAVKNNVGNVTFSEIQSTAGFTVEYRKADESIVCSEDTYTPVAGATSQEVVYARFVKSVNVVVNDNTLASYALRGAEEAKYYVGQSFAIAISVKEGAYVKDVTYADESNKITVGDGNFTYDANTSSLIYLGSMQEDLQTISINAVKITWSSELFPTVYTYSGNSVKFPTEILEKPDNFKVLVSYSSGYEPVEANQSDSENYSLTLIFQNENNVRMGSINTSFHINKKKLEVEQTALQNEKEWDNSTNATIAKVDQAGVIGKIEGDDVVVSATMVFNTTDITSNATVTYTFSISGLDAHNYIAPDVSSYTGIGVITKRKILISFDSYVGVFAGLGKDPSLAGKKIVSKGVIASQRYELVYTFEHTEGKDKGSVGTYNLIVSLSDATEFEDAKKYYEVYFEKDEGDNSAYTSQDAVKEYVVEALEIEADYYIDGEEVDSVVYNGASRTITASFVNENGAKVALSIATDPVDVENASEYTVSVQNFNDANYKLINPTKSIKVEKAKQSQLIVTSPSTHLFGSTYVASIDADSGNGEGVVTFDVVEGYEDYASFEGADLTIKKAGTIALRATKAEGQNYLAESVEWTIEVEKAEIVIKVENTDVFYLDEINLQYVTEEGVAPTGVEGVVIKLDDKEYSGEVIGVGEYQISIDLENATSDGYTLVAGECGKLNVKKLPIIVTANAQSSVYGEQLKELTYVVSDSRVTTLEGTLQTEAKAVGEYDITIGDLVERNANFEITEFISQKYVVTPAKLTVVVEEQTKKYGELDPTPTYKVEGLVEGDSEESIGLNVVLYREKGEESYMEETGGNYAYKYFKNSITHQSANYDADIDFVFNSLVITAGLPTITDVKDLKIVAGTALSGNSAPNATVSGKSYDKATEEWSNVTLAGKITWKENATPDFEESDTLVYVAIFTPENKNYASVEFNVNVKVIPVELTVNFTSPKEITYDGYDHNKIEYELVGLKDGDNANATVTFDGDYKNVGSFKAIVTVANHNYLLNGGEYVVKIVKAPLTITAEDVVLLEGESTSIKYMYFGLQRGDTEDNLSKLPNVRIPSEVGTYELTPSGASSPNYDISYESFTYKILSKTLANEEGDVTLSGKFDADVEFAMGETEEYDEISDLYGDMQSSYANLSKKEIEKVFNLSYKIGEEAVVVEGEIQLTMLKPEGYADDKVAYAIYTNNGELLYVQDVLYDGEYVTLNVTDAQAIVFLVENEKEQSPILYIAIAGVAVVVLIIVLISRKVKKRREERYIKYEQ